MKFQLFAISDALTEHLVRKFLKRLPKSLADTYAYILITSAHRSDGEDRVETMAILFRWICGARRSLRLDELEHAIGVDVDDKYLHSDRTATGAGMRIVGKCNNLVVYNEATATVGFAHHTIQQYLLENSMDNTKIPQTLRLDPLLVEIFLARICLAYLSFSDFETQIVKLPTASMRRTEAEHMVWSGVPFGRSIHRFMASLSSTSQSTSRSDVHLSIPRQSCPSDILIHKYVLLDYIVENWAYHACVMNPTLDEWDSVRQLVLVRRYLFEHRPWQTQEYQSQVDTVLQGMPGSVMNRSRRYYSPLDTNRDTILIYSWIMKHGILAFATFIEHDWVKYYASLSSPGTYESASFLRFFELISSHETDRRVGLGFWNDQLIYKLVQIATRSSFPVDLSICEREFCRRVSTEPDKFNRLVLDTLLYMIKLHDLRNFDILARLKTKTYDDLTCLLIFLIRSSRMDVGILKLLLLLVLEGDISNRLDPELCFVLEKCLPLIEQIVCTERFDFCRVSELLQCRILFVAFALNQKPYFLSKLPPVSKHFPLLENYDWTSTTFGTEESNEKLRQCLPGEVREVHEALIYHAQTPFGGQGHFRLIRTNPRLLK